MKTAIRAFVCFLLLGTLNSCQPDAIDESNPITLIPAGTDMIFAFDPESILRKAEFSSFSQSVFYQAFIADFQLEYPILAAIFARPENSGIRLDRPVYVGFDFDSKHFPGNFGGIFLSLGDPSQLESVLEKAAVVPQTTSSGFQYFQPDSHSIIGWNEQFCIIGYADQEEMKPHLLTSLIEGKSPSLRRHPNIRKWLETPADIAHWVSGESLAGQESTEWIARLLADQRALERSFVHSYVNFDDGAAEMESRFYVHRRLISDIDLLFKRRLETPLWEYLPGKNLEGIMTVGASTRGINQFLLENYSSGLVKLGLSKSGLETDELLKALDGDLALAYYNNRESGKEALVAVAVIADHHQLELLFADALQKDYLSMQGKNRYLLSGPNPLHLFVTDNLIYLSDQADFIDGVSAGFPTMDSEYLTLIKQAAAGKIAAGVAGFPASAFDLRPEEIPVERVEILADRQGMKGQLIFKDQQQNSLRLLLEVMEKSYQRSGRTPVQVKEAQN